jgi:MFS family permease
MEISRNIIILIASGAVRNLGFGFYNVIFAIYLSKLGFSTVSIGTIVTAASLSGVVQTLLGSILMDHYSRKRLMLFWGLLTFIGAAAMAMSSDPAVVAVMSALGLIGARAGGSGAGGLGGPVMVGQIAMLADESSNARRNVIFASNALVLHFAGSLGALLAALPEVFQGYGVDELSSYRLLFVIGAVTTLFYILVLSFYREGPRPKIVGGSAGAAKSFGIGSIIPQKSKWFVAKMALLGSFDSFGSSLHSSLLAYWFFVVYGASLREIGPLFAVSNVIGSLTLIFGAKLADRIGNVNATVITHLPAPLLLVFMPLAPDFQTAAIIQVLRQAIGRMDNPIKQSYMMAVVPREERARARGFTTVFQRFAGSFSPSVAAYMMSAVSTSLPFYLGGAIQFIHDILYYFTFRNLKPPEERVESFAAPAQTQEILEPLTMETNVQSSKYNIQS